MDMLTWDNMDDFYDKIVREFCSGNPFDGWINGYTNAAIIKPEHELSRYGKPLSDKEMALKIRSRIPKARIKPTNRRLKCMKSGRLSDVIKWTHYWATLR